MARIFGDRFWGWVFWNSYDS